MRIYTEKTLSSFSFWGGAKENASELADWKLNAVDEFLGDLYPDGMQETEVNDLFWHDFDTVKEWIGIGAGFWLVGGQPKQLGRIQVSE